MGGRKSDRKPDEGNAEIVGNSSRSIRAIAEDERSLGRKKEMADRVVMHRSY